jgi:hypothetical protein
MHIIPRVDYKKIVSALEHYTHHGFTEIEVPWIIGHQAYIATRPSDREEFYTLGGYLNASGEQSFIELMQSGVKLTKHICVTPCFRKEPVLDDIHFLYFVKAELIDTDVSQENLHAMIATAVSFYEQYLPVSVIQTDTDGNAFDIISTASGIELGSYGIRTYKEYSWIYGTGVALPRLDIAINK